MCGNRERVAYHADDTMTLELEGVNVINNN
jgi:hypothetical protein